jgi:tRNA 2-thiocytidine biosynthesis protein TtcA
MGAGACDVTWPTGNFHLAGIIYAGLLEEVNMRASQASLNPEQDKLYRKIRSQVGRAIADFNMIEAGDVVMVCLSGGADSYTMLDMLLGLQRAAPIEFKLLAVNLDQKQPGFPEQVLPSYLESIGIEYHIVEEDTYSIVKRLIPEGKTTCSLCSRLRRGVLYKTAAKFGASKIALGHHADDMVETAFLNMFFNGRLKSMPPKLLSDDKKNIVIRPLAYVREHRIKAYAQLKSFPIIPCDLCGSQENLQRQTVKAMLAEWDKNCPGRVQNIFNSLCHVAPSHLLDRKLFDFKGLSTGDSKHSHELDTVSDAEVVPELLF